MLVNKRQCDSDRSLNWKDLKGTENEKVRMSTHDTVWYKNNELTKKGIKKDKLETEAERWSDQQKANWVQIRNLTPNVRIRLHEILIQNTGAVNSWYKWGQVAKENTGFVFTCETNAN